MRTSIGLILTAFAPALAWVPQSVPRVHALKQRDIFFRGDIHPVGPAGSMSVLRADKSGGGGEGGGEGGGPGQERGAKGAGTAVITIDKTDVETVTEEKVELDEQGWWRVLLHNDEIHTFEYVTEAIVKVVPQITRKKAFIIARTVHQNGVGTITTVWEELAEQLCMGLQTFGLTVSISPDANFEDNNEGDDR